jgi:hypothetical protein
VLSDDVDGERGKEFSGDNGGTILGIGASVVLRRVGRSGRDETFGDVSIGFSVVALEDWSGFVRGSYQLADDFDAIAGNAGVRYTW